MGKTSIEWTDASWNPIVGCTEISPGCANCYAARLAGTRLKNHPDYKCLSRRTEFCDEHKVPLLDGHCPECRDANGNTFVLDMQSKVLGDRSHWTGEIRFLPERLEEPLHWKKPRRIFVCDMGDLFHEQVQWSWIAEIFLVIQRTPQHTYQILTKRAEKMREFMRTTPILPNVWLGVSVENQHFADQRIPLLLETRAAVRWISAEPLLGPVELPDTQSREIHRWRQLDWVVCGGESGANARPMHPDWARTLRDQCRGAGVPFFFKQWGEWAPLGRIDSSRTFVGHNLGDGQMMLRYGKKLSGRLLDGREWNEFPREAPPNG